MARRSDKIEAKILLVDRKTGEITEFDSLSQEEQVEVATKIKTSLKKSVAENMLFPGSKFEVRPKEKGQALCT